MNIYSPRVVKRFEYHGYTYALFIWSDDDRPRPGEEFQAMPFGLLLAHPPERHADSGKPMGYDYSCIGRMIDPDGAMEENLERLRFGMTRFSQFHRQYEEWQVKLGGPPFSERIDVPESRDLMRAVFYFESCSDADIETLLRELAAPPTDMRSDETPKTL